MQEQPTQPVANEQTTQQPTSLGSNIKPKKSFPWKVTLASLAVVVFVGVSIGAIITSNASTPEKNYKAAQRNVASATKVLNTAKQELDQAKLTRSNYNLKSIEPRYIAAQRALTKATADAKVALDTKNKAPTAADLANKAATAAAATLTQKQKDLTAKQDAQAKAQTAVDNAKKTLDAANKTLSDSIKLTQDALKTYNAAKTSTNYQKYQAASAAQDKAQTSFNSAQKAYNTAAAVLTTAKAATATATEAVRTAEKASHDAALAATKAQAAIQSTATTYQKALDTQKKAQSTVDNLKNYYTIAQDIAAKLAAYNKVYAASPEAKALDTTKAAATKSKVAVDKAQVAVNKATATYNKHKTSTNKTGLNIAKQALSIANSDYKPKLNAYNAAKAAFDKAQATWPTWKEYNTSLQPTLKADTAVKNAEKRVATLTKQLVKAKSQQATAKKAYEQWKAKQNAKKHKASSTIKHNPQPASTQSSTSKAPKRASCKAGQVGTFNGVCYPNYTAWKNVSCATHKLGIDENGRNILQTTCKQSRTHYYAKSSGSGVGYSTQYRTHVTTN